VAENHSGEVADLCVDDLRGYIDCLRERGLVQSSVATKVRSVKAWAKWLVAEEYTARDAFARVKQTRPEEKAKETLTPDEVDTLLAGCNRRTITGARDFAIMLLLFSTGLRAAEVVGLRIEDVDTDKALVLVRRGKGGKFCVAPLGHAVEKALYKYLQHPRRRGQESHGPLFVTDEGTPLTVAGLQQMFKRRGMAAGIQANPHKWRHSAVSSISVAEAAWRRYAQCSATRR
jgi:integrase/recombinase XerD